MASLSELAALAAKTHAAPAPAPAPAASLLSQAKPLPLALPAQQTAPPMQQVTPPEEIPIGVPVRHHESLDAQQQAFVIMLDSVHTLHGDPEAIKGAVERIMIDMRESPHLVDLLEDDDVAVIIRRMKSILGFRKATVEKKTSSRRRTEDPAITDFKNAMEEMGLLDD